jgi:hypothetical protein
MMFFQSFGDDRQPADFWEGLPPHLGSFYRMCQEVSPWFLDRLVEGTRYRVMKLEGSHRKPGESWEDLIQARVVAAYRLYLEAGGNRFVCAGSPWIDAVGPGYPMASIAGDRIRMFVSQALRGYYGNLVPDLERLVDEAVTDTLLQNRLRIGSVSEYFARLRESEGSNRKFTVLDFEGLMIHGSRQRASRLIKKRFKEILQLKEYGGSQYGQLEGELVKIPSGITCDLVGTETYNLAIDALRKEVIFQSPANQFIFEKLLEFWTLEDLLASEELTRMVRNESKYKNNYFAIKLSIVVRRAKVIAQINRKARELRLFELLKGTQWDS